MNAEDRLRETVDAIDEQIRHIAKRPNMYVGGEAHHHAAEVMVRVLLHVRDQAVGRETVDRNVERKYLFKKYPDVPGPLRSVTSASKRMSLNFEAELLAYVEWYNHL